MAEVRIFSAKQYDRDGFTQANARHGHALTFLETRLELDTVELAAGAPAVCVFVNDDVSAPVIDTLADGGTTCIALRCAGFNNVDLEAAARRWHHRGARAGLLAKRSRGAHARTDPGTQPSDPPRLQPGSRRQFRARRTGRLRSGRQDRRRRRHRQDRHDRRPAPLAPSLQSARRRSPARSASGRARRRVRVARPPHGRE